MDNDLTLKAAVLKLDFVTEVDFDRAVDPAKIQWGLETKGLDGKVN